jgi:hypothetical protein
LEFTPFLTTHIINAKESQKLLTLGNMIGTGWSFEISSLDWGLNVDYGGFTSG